MTVKGLGYQSWRIRVGFQGRTLGQIIFHFNAVFFRNWPNNKFDSHHGVGAPSFLRNPEFSSASAIFVYK